MSDPAVWRELDSAEAVASALVELYGRRGGDRYDEVITQTEHALQCGALAIAAGADDATVVAAFLHDIGHLLASGMDRDRDLHHEDVGSRFLSAWFGPEVTEPIRLHVAAKRFLCATSPEYHDGLSAASVASLVLQGGPMSPEEAAEFEANPAATTAVDVRRWDDEAKIQDAPTPDLAVFAEIMTNLVRL